MLARLVSKTKAPSRFKSCSYGTNKRSQHIYRNESILRFELANSSVTTAAAWKKTTSTSSCGVLVKTHFGPSCDTEATSFPLSMKLMLDPAFWTRKLRRDESPWNYVNASGPREEGGRGGGEEGRGGKEVGAKWM
eukprot:747115-Hanusia_phi.AAC.6